MKQEKKGHISDEMMEYASEVYGKEAISFLSGFALKNKSSEDLSEWVADSVKRITTPKAINKLDVSKNVLLRLMANNRFDDWKGVLLAIKEMDVPSFKKMTALRLSGVDWVSAWLDINTSGYQMSGFWRGRDVTQLKREDAIFLLKNDKDFGDKKKIAGISNSCLIPKDACENLFNLSMNDKELLLLTKDWFQRRKDILLKRFDNKDNKSNGYEHRLIFDLYKSVLNKKNVQGFVDAFIEEFVSKDKRVIELGEVVVNDGWISMCAVILKNGNDPIKMLRMLDYDEFKDIKKDILKKCQNQNLDSEFVNWWQKINLLDSLKVKSDNVKHSL